MNGAIIFTSVVAPLLVAAIVGLTVAVMRVARPLRGFLRDWAGEPARPGVARKAGVMERLSAVDNLSADVAELRDRVGEIHYEVKPNGGGSLADDIRRIKRAVPGADEE